MLYVSLDRTPNVLTRMWADAHHDGRQAVYRCRPLRKFLNCIPCTTPQARSLADAHALLECRAVTLPI